MAELKVEAPPRRKNSYSKTKDKEKEKEKPEKGEKAEKSEKAHPSPVLTASNDAGEEVLRPDARGRPADRGERGGAAGRSRGALHGRDPCRRDGLQAQQHERAGQIRLCYEAH